MSKFHIIRLPVIGVVLIMLTLFAWKHRTPEPYEFIVPYGRVVNASRGLSNVSLTNQCVVVWRADSDVMISNVVVYFAANWDEADERRIGIYVGSADSYRNVLTFQGCTVQNAWCGYYHCAIPDK